MPSPVIAARVVSLGRTILSSSANFTKSLGRIGSGVVNPTRDKIKENNKTIKSNSSKRRNLFTRLRETRNRRARENNIEITGKVRTIAQAVKNIIRKPFDAFLQLLGALILRSLPFIIKEINILRKKIRIFMAALRSSVSSILAVARSVINITKAYAQNIASFDFADESKRVETAMNELSTSTEELGTGLSELRNVWGRDEKELDEIIKGLESGDNLNQSLDRIFDNAFGPRATTPTETVTGQPVQPSVSGDAAESRLSALGDLIGGGEGGYNSVNRGNAGDTPGGSEALFGKALTDMTIGEIRRAQDAQKVFAVGKYQIIPKTMREWVENDPSVSDSDKFDAKTQEKFLKYAVDVKRPQVGRYLRGENDNRDEAIQELAREFASVGLQYGEAGRRRGQSRYAGTGGNAASISPDEVGEALDLGRSLQSRPEQQSQPAQPGAAPTGTSRVVDELNVATDRSPLGGITPGSTFRSASRPNHNGIDIGTYGARGFKVAFLGKGKVTRVSNDPGGYGNYVIITIPSMGMSFMFAHLAKAYVRVGDSYNGQAIGEIGKTGSSSDIHLHYEAYIGGWDGKVVDPKPYLKYLSIGRQIQSNNQAAVQTPPNAERVAALTEQVSSNPTGGTMTNTVAMRQERVILVGGGTVV